MALACALMLASSGINQLWVIKRAVCLQFVVRKVVVVETEEKEEVAVKKQS